MIKTQAGTETLATAAYERLRREIITAQIPPGTRLHTRHLCLRLEMGLSPIREALNRLSTEGIVQRHEQRGFTVAPLDAEDLDEINRTRIWLNETALRKLIAQDDGAWEERVVLAWHRLSRLPRFLPDEVRNPDWEQAHRNFHHSLVSGCRSRWLVGFCNQLFDAFERYRSLSPFGETIRPSHVDEHRAIMAAALARDADKAAELLRAHFALSAVLVRASLPSPPEAPRPARRRAPR